MVAGAQRKSSSHSVRRAALSRKFPVVADSPAGQFALLPEVGARDQPHLGNEAIGRDDQQIVVAIVSRAAPGHSTDVAGNDERSPQTRRRKDAFGPKLADFLAAPFSVGLVGAPDIVRPKRLRYQRAWSNRERLCGRGNLAGDIGPGNRPLLDSEDGFSVLPIQNEEIAGLGANT